MGICCEFQVVLSVAEHHSNIVPWQLIAEKTGIVLKFAGLTEDERIDVAELKTLISNKTKLVALCHVSNTLGQLPLMALTSTHSCQLHLLGIEV